MSDTQNPIRKPRDGVVASLFAAPLAEPHARRLADTSVTPNQVTAVSTAMSVLGAWLLGSRRLDLRLAGFCVHQYGFVLDCTDGQLARLTGRESAFGAALDEVSDRAGELYLIDRLGRAGGETGLATSAVGFLLSRHVLSRLLHTKLKNRPSAAEGSASSHQASDGGADAVMEHLRAASNLTIGDRLGLVTIASVVSPAAGIRTHAGLGFVGVLRDIAARRHRGVTNPNPIQLSGLVLAPLSFWLSARVTTNPGMRAVLPYVFLSICRTLSERGQNE